MTTNEWRAYCKCPRCGSENVSETLIGGPLDAPSPNSYRCEDCKAFGYIRDIPSPQPDITVFGALETF